MALASCSVSKKPAETNKAEATTQTSREETQETTKDKTGESRYDSPDGWSVRYDNKLFHVNETDAHTVNFDYLGESSGTNEVTISYVEGQQPEEAMSKITDKWGDGNAIERTEGFFPGTTDKWGYFRTLSATDGSGLTKTLIGGEYNGGALLFEITGHSYEDEEETMLVSDSLANIVDSVEYKNFEDQTMYSYIPGTYVQDVNEEYVGSDGKTEPTHISYSIVLNEDHTGTINLQDSIDILWGSIELMTPDQAYEYTIEGDSLMVNMDDNWLEFHLQPQL